MNRLLGTLGTVRFPQNTDAAEAHPSSIQEVITLIRVLAIQRRHCRCYPLHQYRREVYGQATLLSCEGICCVMMAC